MPMLRWIFLTGVLESISQLVETFAVLKKIPLNKKILLPVVANAQLPLTPMRVTHTSRRVNLNVWL